MENLYADIAARTNGNIYIGVVGPVRTGKSTFIKRFMEELVIPNIEDPYRADRAKDELPQSGSGRTIMTSEPKFIPEEAVEIYPDGNTALHARLIDTVGYMVDSAAGAEENGAPRMVTTPWYDYEIPMTQAAELGTKKVMEEHCTIGLVITTDGSITDIPRSDYIAAENKAIQDMKATGKPFLVVINSCQCNSEKATALRDEIAQKHGVNAIVADCQALDTASICHVLHELLLSFPMYALHVRLPGWFDALETSHPLKRGLFSALIENTEQIDTLCQAKQFLPALQQVESVQDVVLETIDPSSGIVCISLHFPEEMFYEILSKKTGIPIQSDAELFNILCELTAIKKEYEKVESALSAVKATGYGVVMPTAEEMKLQPPEILRKSGAYGVKLKAGAPSIHMIRVDIDTEISPMVGDEKQSQDLISYLSAEAPETLWESNIFGKSVYALIQEGLTAKLISTPQDVQTKFRDTLTKIVNEGATGLICLIL